MRRPWLELPQRMTRSCSRSALEQAFGRSQTSKPLTVTLAIQSEVIMICLQEILSVNLLLRPRKCCDSADFTFQTVLELVCSTSYIWFTSLFISWVAHCLIKGGLIPQQRSFAMGSSARFRSGLVPESSGAILPPQFHGQVLEVFPGQFKVIVRSSKRILRLRLMQCFERFQGSGSARF